MRWETDSSSRLIENLQRSDLNAIETARAYKLLMETYDLTQAASSPSGSESRVRPWPTCSGPSPRASAPDAVIEGKIGEVTSSLLPLPLSDALQALAAVIAKGLSVARPRRLPERWSIRHAVVGRGAAPRRRSGRRLQVTSELRAALGTRSRSLRGRRAAASRSSFYSDEDSSASFESFSVQEKA